MFKLVLEKAEESEIKLPTSAVSLKKQESSRKTLAFVLLWRRKWQPIPVLFPYLEPVCFSISSSNCCFLTYIQIYQESGKVIWYSHLLKNFPQFVVIHTGKGFGIVNKPEIYVFLELSCFLYDPADIGNLISGSSAFSKSSLNIWKFTVHVLHGSC